MKFSFSLIFHCSTSFSLLNSHNLLIFKFESTSKELKFILNKINKCYVKTCYTHSMVSVVKTEPFDTKATDVMFNVGKYQRYTFTRTEFVVLRFCLITVFPIFCFLWFRFCFFFFCDKHTSSTMLKRIICGMKIRRFFRFFFLFFLVLSDSMMIHAQQFVAMNDEDKMKT